MEPRALLVSGGSKGLGLAIVKDSLATGWSVATFSRTPTKAMDELQSMYPGRFTFFCGDISDPETPRMAVSKTVETLGRIDAVVNNAAVAFDGILATMPTEIIIKCVETNLTSTLLMCREAAREFLRTRTKERRTILNVSSIVGISGFRGLSVYSSTKSALIGVTKSLARELGPANVAVNAVLPGFLITDMSDSLQPAQREQIRRRTPLGRLGEVSDIVPVVRFLLSSDSAFITGQSIVVDGGATC